MCIWQHDKGKYHIYLTHIPLEFRKIYKTNPVVAKLIPKCNDKYSIPGPLVSYRVWVKSVFGENDKIHLHGYMGNACILSQADYFWGYKQEK